MNLLYLKIRKYLLPLLWIFIIFLGVVFLNRYSINPTHKPIYGDLRWPSQSKLKAPENKPLLVMFLHPHCPCSRASVNELERLMPHIQQKFDVHALFIKPESRDLNWVKSDLYLKVESMPNIHVFIDENYQETNFFNATTSGQVMLYDKNFKKVFSGAITPGRGHEGDSLGKDLLIQFANGQKFDRPQILNSYGCSLKDLNNQVTTDDS